MKKFKTINQVINRGQLEITLPIALLIFGCPFLSFGIDNWFLDSKYIGVSIFIGLFLGFISAWAWWSYRIVKWRIWAFENTKKSDWLAVKAMAINTNLIWRDGSRFEKTEIRSKQESLKIKKINQQIDAIEINTVQNNSLLKIKDDPMIPYETFHFYKKSELILLPILIAIISAIGIYFLFNNQLFYGIFSILVGFKLFDLDKLKQLQRRSPQLTINEQGIDLKFVKLKMIEWKDTENIYLNTFDKVLKIDMVQEHESYKLTIPLNELHIENIDELARTINIYLKRYYEKVKLN